MNGITQQLARLVTTTEFNCLPEGAVKKIKLMLLDSIGCALGGHITDRAKITLELVGELGGNAQASIIGAGCNSYALAAFCNGELINALDYDYIGPLAAHVCPYVTSPCLAIAERAHASGKELILALALAHEIGGRAQSSLAQQKILKKEPPYYEESPRFSPTSAVFGAVAGASKLLALDVQQMSNAFGIAGASTAVPAMLKWHHSGGAAFMNKYNCWAGWIAQLATVAVLAAERGFTGDTTILDGEWGFWQIVGSPFFKVDNLLKKLGETWHIEEVNFKFYPTCGEHHAGIEGICKIMKEHGIKPAEIEQIEIKGDPLMEVPVRMGMDMETFTDIQFRNTYVFGLAPYYGHSPSPAWQLPTVFKSPEIAAMAKRVKIALHPQTSELITKLIKAGRLPMFWNTIVEITARGRKFTTEVPAPKGHPDNPTTEAELVEKFRVNASYSMLKSSKVEGIIRVIMELEELDDTGRLSDLLTVG